MPHRVIEGTSEIIEHVAGNESDLAWERFNAAKMIDSLSRLRIILEVDSIGLRLLKPIALDLEIVDVLIGPYHFAD
jgi:hypothetical protein